MAETLSRLSTIQETISQIAHDILAPDMARADAQTLVKEARGELESARESLLLKAAKISADQQWELKEIQIASKAAAKAYNKGQSAATTLIADIRRVAAPIARDHAERLNVLVKAVWEAEDASGDKPCHKAFQRKYHTWLRALDRVVEGHPVPDAKALTAFAAENDPSLSVSKAAKAIAKISAQVMDVYAHFPAACLDNAIKELVKATEIELARAGASDRALPVKAAKAEVKHEAPKVSIEEAIRETFAREELAEAA